MQKYTEKQPGLQKGTQVNERMNIDERLNAKNSQTHLICIKSHPQKYKINLADAETPKHIH